ncbi:SLBB domain-containing protein [Sphingomonas sp. I4]
MRGLTSTQLQDRIVARLSDGYVKDPRVAVEVLTTRPFYILGEVNKPGQYPFANGLTVLGAVAQAGAIPIAPRPSRCSSSTRVPTPR